MVSGKLSNPKNSPAALSQRSPCACKRGKLDNNIQNMPTSKSEGSPDLPQRNPRWERVGVVAASLAAWTAGGAYLGYEGGTRLEKSGNIAYAEQATRYERCLTLVKKKSKARARNCCSSFILHVFTGTGRLWIWWS